MTREEETSAERAEFEAALEEARGLLAPPDPAHVLARLIVARHEVVRDRDEAEADLGRVAVALGLSDQAPASAVIGRVKTMRAAEALIDEVRGVVGRPALSIADAVRRHGDDARESRNTLRSALDAANRCIGQIAVALGLSEHASGIAVVDRVKDIRASVTTLTSERDAARAEVERLTRALESAEKDAETQLAAAVDLGAALDRVADAAGVDSDSAATVVADRVVSVIKELRTETACHRISAAQMRRALERVAAAVGVEADADTDFIVERVERATSVIKELREELNRRVAAAATSTPPTVDELLVKAPVGSIIECERDEPGKFAQIKIVPGRFWRRRSWADGAWWSWGDVSVLEIDVLKRRALLVTEAEAGADPASRWSIGGGS